MLRIAPGQRRAALVDGLHAHQVRLGIERAVAPAPARHAEHLAARVVRRHLQPHLVRIHRAAREAVTDTARAHQRVDARRARPDQRQRRAPAQVVQRALQLVGVAAQVGQGGVRAQEAVRAHHAVLRAGVALHGGLERHVAVLALLRGLGSIHRARAVAGHRADVPRVVVVLAAQPAVAGGDVGAQSHLVAGGAEQRLGHQRRPQPRAVRALRRRHRPQIGLVAPVADLVDVCDRMADQARDAGLRGARAALDLRLVHRAGRDQERFVAVAAEARRDRALLLAERIGGDAVVRVVERREPVRGRRPLRRDVAVAADAVAAADGRARVKAIARDLHGDLFVAGAFFDTQRDADVASVRLEAGKFDSVAGRAARDDGDAGSEHRGGDAPDPAWAGVRVALAHGVVVLRRWGGLPGIPSDGTGERTSSLSATLPRGAVASPLAAVGVGRASRLPGGPPQMSNCGCLQATGSSSSGG